MSSWHSYPKVYNIGHPAIEGLFLDEVHVEEKVDGSQFSFGVFDGEFKARSKGREQYPGTDKMFQLAVDTARGLDLTEGWTYSGELLNNPKHNTIKYDRVPLSNIVIFDIRVGEESYLTYEGKKAEANRVGLEVAPKLHEGKVVAVEDLMELLETESFLGGHKIEGIVVKNYQRFTRDGKAMLGKHVCEKFREQNVKDFRRRNPTQGDIIKALCDKYRTEARWEKAIQHLRDDGRLLNDPKDIGELIKEVQRDLREEEEEQIKEDLFRYAWKHVSRRSTAGLPEWYKDQLLKRAFEKEGE